MNYASTICLNQMIPIDVTYNYLILFRDDLDISQSILLISVNELCFFLLQCGSRGTMTVLQTDILFNNNLEFDDGSNL